MKQWQNSLTKLLIYMAQLCVLLVLTWIIWRNLNHMAYVEFIGGEKVDILQATWSWLPFAALSLALVFLAANFKGRTVYIVCSLIYCLLFIFLSSQIDFGLRADADIVYQLSQTLFSENKAAVFSEDYFLKYPFQLGLMIYDGLLTRLWSSPKIIFFVNFLQILAINYLVAKLTLLVFGDRHGLESMTIMLSFLFLPQLIYVHFGYGLIPGFFFLILGAYLLMKGIKASQFAWAYYLTACLAFSLSVIIRQNFAIGIIAIIIGLFVSLIGKNSWSKVFLLLSLIACLILPSRLLAFSYELILDQDFPSGSPSNLWVAMGTDPQNLDRSAGWYNGFNYNTMSQVNNDYDQAKAIGQTKLKENIAYFQENPAYFQDYFNLKIDSQWTEPTFQSLWTTSRAAQTYHSKWGGSLHQESFTFANIYQACRGIYLLILIASLAFICFHFRGKASFLPFMIYLVGGFLFHLVWEGKSQYLYTYVFTLIPLAARLLNDIVYYIPGWNSQD